ncbi:MAG: hypothetical protein QY322_01975 [bacterium]|nr:MAG: hypothetical protein QY322_01975 [bacterium]
MESTLNPVQRSASVVKQFSTTNSGQNQSKKNIILALISITVVLLGIGAGYLLSGAGKDSDGFLSISKEQTIIVSENEAGVADESIFASTADGLLEEGGIADEGTHHLVRGVGPSQYAYLTSTSVDLDKFVGKKVRIWGDTISGKKAGWLIDVGKIKVIE